MESPLNGGNWLYSPVQEGGPLLNPDFPIRRFCPARMAESGPCGSLPCVPHSPILLPPLHLPSPSSPPTHYLFSPDLHFDSAQVDDFVDSFFNMDADGMCVDPPEEGGENGPSSTVANADIHVFDVIEGDGEFDVRVLSKESASPADDANEINHDEGLEVGVDQGLLLVHSLLACAEAVGCRDTQLADSLLSQLWPFISPTGNSLQRVSYCFATGLNARLSLLHNTGVNGNFGMTTDMIDDAGLYPTVTKEEKIDAFRLLHQSTPYISFAFLVANEAISLASQGKDSLHIIDLGMEHTLQWPSLLQALGSRTEGPPKCVRITGIVNLARDINDSLISDLESSMKQLVDIGRSVGIASLECNLVTEPPTPSLFTKEKLKVREGEALFVNSIMQLHRYVKESRGTLKAILQAMKRMGSTLLTVAEQDANHNGPFFMGRFLESLHYYSAIFDSLEASMPRGSVERMKIERLHYAEEIRNIVGREGKERVERHERAEQWRRQLGRAGFQRVGLKCMGVVRAMVSGYGCEGYTVAGEKGCLLLGWEGRPIMSASAWQLQPSPSRSSSSSSFP